MKTKQIPFSFEIVKKIQAGEIKGTILTRDGRPARFLGEIKDTVYPLVFAREIEHITAKEFLDVYTLTGSYNAALDKHDNDIILEIEDEQQNHEYKFKVGDKVRLKPNDTHSHFVRQYNNCVGKIIEIFNEIFIVVLEGVFQDLFKADELEPVEEIRKHEFKPFDKVLVRNSSNQKWHPNFYATTDGLLFYTTDCRNWYQCILYTGNESLVGTTDKPKEY